uniref:TLC domain-containing protein n=1 Tax=Entomoneis paludosa TaxID=265537 RepID=A0A7S2YPI1_9STRA|mmetsp:Transcript_4297/g.9231  ORF Transcript_4297/g.9231 Transcript_4297/m.9231 type:complete len:286 (+) Transcript_4297:249-1106(+)
MASKWSISNADSYIEGETWESFINHNVPAGMMLGVLVVCVSYPILHQVYMAKSAKYRDLSTDQQVVVVQHTTQAIFLSIIFGPMSYLILSLFFEEQSSEKLGNKVAAIATLMFVVIIMYMVEIASRFRNMRPLVLAHHLCAYLDSIYPAFFLTTANMKAASLLVYFITYEALTFIGLVLYRLAPQNRWTRPTILTGMIVFGLSRPVQFVWIFGSLIATWDDLDVGHAIFQMVLTFVFTILQVYSLTIHWSLYQKCQPEVSSLNRDEGKNRDLTLSCQGESPSDEV